MGYFVIWFVLLSGNVPPSYIAPQDVKAGMAGYVCNLEGAVTGILLDRERNPTTVRVPDPHVVGKHCTVDVRDRVQSLLPGEYEFATTHMGDGTRETFITADPHTSVRWTRALDGTPSKPTNLKVPQ